MPGRLKGLAATRVYRRYLPPLRWCSSCGVPVLGAEKCPLCGGPLRSVEHLAPPGDVRPLLGDEEAILRTAMEGSVGPGLAHRLLPGKAFVLLNRVQAIDTADAVIVDGRVIGTLFYDIVERKWKFRLDYYGAKLAVDEELGPYAIARQRIRPGQVLERHDLRLSPEADRAEYIAVKSGRVYGVAKRLPTGAFRVLKTWVPRGRDEYKPKPATINEVLEANRERLERLEEDAVSFLTNVEKKGIAMTAISGGKDSTVAAALAAKAGIKRAYFLDTGLEFPETIETAERVTETLGLETRWVTAGDAFWRALRVYGPPARDYRWCCKVVKLAPLARQLKPYVPGRLVTVTGQRGYESTQRAQAGRLAPSASTGLDDLIAAPIQYWTGLDVHLYILKENLPLNPLYTRGYDRIGCYLCPASRLSEFETVKRTHPELWERWENYLASYARERGLPRQWIDYGLWRWRFSYPGEIVHLAKRLGIDPVEAIRKTLLSTASHTIDYTRKGKCHTIYLDRGVGSPKHFLTLLKTTGLHSKARLEDGKVVIIDRDADVQVTVTSDGRIEVCSKTWRNTKKILAVLVKTIQPLYMLIKCYGCSLCVAACPHKAMKAPHTIDPSKCQSCMTCVHTCPSASKLSKHVIKLFEEQVKAETRVSRGAHPHQKRRKRR